MPATRHARAPVVLRRSLTRRRTEPSPPAAPPPSLVTSPDTRHSFSRSKGEALLQAPDGKTRPEPAACDSPLAASPGCAATASI